MKGKYTRLIIELIAWTAFIGFPLIIFPSIKPFFSQGQLHPVVKGILITHSLLILFYYLNCYLLIPRLYFEKKYSAYVASLILFFTALVLLLQTDLRYNPIPSTYQYARIVFIFSILIRFGMAFLLSFGISQIARLQKAESEKLRTELAFLKAQINPHFLFNTLNSIYALTVKKSGEAPAAVTKLSAIMRYIITDAAADFVPLEQELNYLDSYVELERLRLTSKVRLDYSISGDPAGKQIAPLIFIPLVENAFKYGVATREESEIRIKIMISAERLFVEIMNRKIRNESGTSDGLGLENVKRRLKLLYPGNYILNIQDQESIFSVNLELELNDQLHSNR